MRRRIDASRTNDLWENIHEAFEDKNIIEINKISDLEGYEIINKEDVSSYDSNFFIQFLVIPIKKGDKKGLIIPSLEKRVPPEIIEEFEDFIFLTSEKECLKTIKTKFMNKNKQIIEEGKSATEYIKEMLTKMELLGAADLNLSWTRKKVIATYTVDGISSTEHEDKISLPFAEKLKTAIVNMSYENNAKKKIDGKFFINILNIEKEYRLSVIESIAGYALAIRSYEKFDTNQTLETLGYMRRPIEIIEDIIKTNPYGLFLISGKTGTGKTTTIYTLINQLYQKYNYRIKTAEEPVEIQIDGIDQCQINKNGDRENWITYLDLLSSFLRQKPDIMVISEIRDKDVALSTIEAALTGHIVLSTIHTNNVKATFTRLKKTMGISEDRIEDCMSGILSQRLVPKLCSCKIKDGEHYKRNEEGCEICKGSKIKGYDNLIPAVEIASLKKVENNDLKENYKMYYSYIDSANELYDKGYIDEVVKKQIITFQS